MSVARVAVDVLGKFVGHFSHDGQDRLHVVLFQERIGVIVVVVVSVVKGYHDRIFRQGAAAFGECDDFLHEHRSVAFLFYVFQVSFEEIR